MELAVFTIWYLYLVLPGRCSSSERDPADFKVNEPNWGREERNVQQLKKKQENVEHAMEEMDEYNAEKQAGDQADMLGSNIHHSYPTVFKDLGRRFVPQYPYTEKKPSKSYSESKDYVKSQRNDYEIIPVKASSTEVLKVAMESAIEQFKKPDFNNTDELMQKEILRTGNYWDAVWTEEVDPSMLRSYTKNDYNTQNTKYRSDVPNLGSVKVKIMPGSKLYQLVSILKQYSPRLLYVINNRN